MTGTIKVEAQMVIEISKFGEELSLQVSVIDKGVGMSEEEVQRIFDPFFSSPNQKDKNPTGIGMGLTICKQIC